jgi:hypothetical protein
VGVLRFRRGASTWRVADGDPVTQDRQFLRRAFRAPCPIRFA